MMSRTLVAAALARGAWPALADTVASKKTLTLEGARKAIAAVEEAARKAGATGVVAVVDDGGNLISLALALGGAAALGSAN
jgi:uncharacterized protein GlcG (DUF336 family)